MLSRFIVGIDCGSDTISVIIAEVFDWQKIRILGVGQSESEGIRDGVVRNIDGTAEALRTAISEAELMAGIKISDAYVSISGEHIKSVKSNGIVAVSRGKNDDITPRISASDVDRVLENARSRIMLSDSSILHILPQDFIIDGEKVVDLNPVGSSGLRLESNVNIITGGINEIQNLVNAMQLANVTVKELVFSPFAASYSTLTKDERELGVALMEFGSGTTNVALFYEDSLRYTKSFKWGGQHITRDMTRILGLSTYNAEKLKKDYGSVTPPIEPDAIPVKVTGQQKMIDPDKLNKIVYARMDEILRRMVLKEFTEKGLQKMLAGGLVLTGGGALMGDLESLVKEVFGCEARIGYPSGIQGISNGVNSPSWANCIGLVLYGLESESEMNAPDEDGRSERTGSVKGILSGVKVWLKKKM